MKWNDIYVLTLKPEPIALPFSRFLQPANLKSTSPKPHLRHERAVAGDVVIRKPFIAHGPKDILASLAPAGFRV